MVSRAGIDIGTMIVGIMGTTTGTIIAIGTTTVIATVATSTSMTTTRRADIVALATDATIHIVEIKSSVADFRADTKWHYRAHCNRLFFAIPETVPVEIMPQDAGLILADSYGAIWRRNFARGAGTSDNWNGLDATMPTLTALVTEAPSSGNLATLFLNLVESSPRAALLPFVVQATTAWCSAYGVDSRVDDWRGSGRSRGVAVIRRLSLATGASVQAVAPFPVAARQTGQADFPHPAFTHSIKPSLLAGRRGAQGYEKARAFHAGSPARIAQSRARFSPCASATSVAIDDQRICGSGHRFP